MQFKGIFLGGTTLSHLEEKLKLYQINIYIFSFNTAPIHEKTNYFTSKVASLYFMTVPVFELPGTTSNMYFVHVDLMNSVLYLLYPRFELSGHLNKTVKLTSMPS